MRKEYKNLILFLLISFLLPYVAIVFQTMISNDFICFVLYGIQAASPTISAIVVLCLNKKVKTHFAQMVRKEHLQIAIFLPIIIAYATAMDDFSHALCQSLLCDALLGMLGMLSHNRFDFWFL